MPYDRLTDLPDDVKQQSKKKQRKFRSVFNSVWGSYSKKKDKGYDDTKTEAQNRERYCFSVAYAAIKDNKTNKIDNEENIMGKVSMFIPIVKVDEEKRIIRGTATTEAKDSSGEILEYKGSKKAFSDWFKWANVREMHNASAVGKGLSWEGNEEQKKIDVEVKVVDDNAWNKVKEGVYQGFSVGGNRVESEVVKGDDGEDVRMTNKWDMVELSLVDRGANPEAVFSIAKRNEVKDEKVVIAKTETPKELTAEEVEKARGDGQGQDGQRQGDGGADYCVCPECGYYEKHTEKGTPCNEIDCPKCGVEMAGADTEPKKADKIKKVAGSFEDRRDKIRLAINRLFAPKKKPNNPDVVEYVDVSIIATYSTNVIVQDYRSNQYFHIGYVYKDDNVVLGDKTEVQMTFTPIKEETKKMILKKEDYLKMTVEKANELKLTVEQSVELSEKGEIEIDEIEKTETPEVVEETPVVEKVTEPEVVEEIEKKEVVEPEVEDTELAEFKKEFVKLSGELTDTQKRLKKVEEQPVVRKGEPIEVKKGDAQEEDTTEVKKVKESYHSAIDSIVGKKDSTFAEATAKIERLVKEQKMGSENETMRATLYDSLAKMKSLDLV